MTISRKELGKLEPVTAEDDEQLQKEHDKEYSKNYCEKHRKEKQEYDRKYREDHAEQIKEYLGEYYEENKEVLKPLSRQYYADHKEEDKERHRRWKECNPEKVQAMSRRRNAKRRLLSYEEILPPQWGYVMHHVDDTRVIPIPEMVHRHFSNLDTKEHRRLIDEWMREIRPDLWLIVHTEEAFKMFLEK